MTFEIQFTMEAMKRACQYGLAYELKPKSCQAVIDYIHELEKRIAKLEKKVEERQ